MAFGLFLIFRTTSFSIRLCDPGRAQSYCLAESLALLYFTQDGKLDERALMTESFLGHSGVGAPGWQEASR